MASDYTHVHFIENKWNSKSDLTDFIINIFVLSKWKLKKIYIYQLSNTLKQAI